MGAAAVDLVAEVAGSGFRLWTARDGVVDPHRELGERLPGVAVLEQASDAVVVLDLVHGFVVRLGDLKVQVQGDASGSKDKPPTLVL